MLNSPICLVATVLDSRENVSIITESSTGWCCSKGTNAGQKGSSIWIMSWDREYRDEGWEAGRKGKKSDHVTPLLENFLGSPALRTESSMLPIWPKESGSYLPFQPQSTPYFWFSVLQPQKHFMVLAFAWGPPVGFSLFPLSPQSHPQASNSLTCAHPSTFNQGATFTRRTDLTELQR